MRKGLAVILALFVVTCREETREKQAYPKYGGLIFAPTPEDDCLRQEHPPTTSEITRLLVYLVEENTGSVVQTYELLPSEASTLMTKEVTPGRYILKALACNNNNIVFEGESEPFSVDANRIYAPLVYMTRVGKPSCIGQGNSHPLVKDNRFQNDGRLAFGAMCSLDETHVVLAGGIRRVTPSPKGLFLEAGDELFVYSIRTGIFETVKDDEGFVVKLLEPRAMHRCAVVDKNRVVVFGGIKKAALVLPGTKYAGDVLDDVLPVNHMIEVVSLSGENTEVPSFTYQAALPSVDFREDLGIAVVAGGIGARKDVLQKIAVWEYKSGRVVEGDLKIPRFAGNAHILRTGQILLLGGGGGGEKNGVELAWIEDGQVSSIFSMDITVPASFASSLLVKDDSHEAHILLVSGVLYKDNGFSSASEPTVMILKLKGDGNVYGLENAQVQDITLDTTLQGFTIPPFPSLLRIGDNAFLLNAFASRQDGLPVSCSDYLTKDVCSSEIIVLTLDREHGKLVQSERFSEYHLRVGGSTFAIKDSLAMVFGGIALDRGVQNPILLSTGFAYPVAQTDKEVGCVK